MGGLAYINLKSELQFSHSHVKQWHLKTRIIVLGSNLYVITNCMKSALNSLKSLGNSLLVNLCSWIKTSSSYILIWDSCHKMCLRSYALLSTCEVLKFSWAHWLVICSICMVCKSEILEPPILPWSALKSSKGIWTALSPHFWSRSSMERLELQRKICVKSYQIQISDCPNVAD